MLSYVTDATSLVQPARASKDFTQTHKMSMHPFEQTLHADVTQCINRCTNRIIVSEINA